MVNTQLADPERFGIDPDGRAYYDAAEPVAAEAAVLTVVDRTRVHLKVS